MGTDKRSTLTLGLRKKLADSHSQNEEQSQTILEKRSKLTLGLKKKPQISQPQNEYQTAFEKRQNSPLGLGKKTVLTQPQSEPKAQTTTGRTVLTPPQSEPKAQTTTGRYPSFGSGPRQRHEFIPQSALARPQRPPPMPKRTTIRMPNTQGRLEVSIKISELPNWVETTKRDWQRICINADGQIVQMNVRPRIWNKLIQANEEYPMWVASITGKMGPRIKGGFELLEVGVQVYEKIPREPNESKDEE
ncbi:MAG: hypothetical protein DRR19_24530 [Candidatus Parabeggiatoa sp. nov. 1]|nr:MAG: hypothetical protein DRR19_24530 [Gammaproteobacteria bacterium]